MADFFGGGFLFNGGSGIDLGLSPEVWDYIRLCKLGSQAVSGGLRLEYLWVGAKVDRLQS